MFQVNPLHMKNQALFSSKDKSKKLKCGLLQFLLGALRVKSWDKYASTISEAKYMLFIKKLSDQGQC